MDKNTLINRLLAAYTIDDLCALARETIAEIGDPEGSDDMMDYAVGAAQVYAELMGILRNTWGSDATDDLRAWLSESPTTWYATDGDLRFSLGIAGDEEFNAAWSDYVWGELEAGDDE